mmetsp:Transcript_32002/g.91860  ORF Transcript_32002/g.91860 Transcript_32002/m.91860 type:complete len:418 (+) Transcript_32002:148-1401(+)
MASQGAVAVAPADHAGDDVVELQRDDDADDGDPRRQGREGDGGGPAQRGELQLDAEPQQQGVRHRGVLGDVAVHPVLDEVEVEGGEAAGQEQAEAHPRVGLLLEVDHPAVQDHPLLAHAEVGGRGYGHAAGRAGVLQVLDVAPGPPHVHVDEEVRQHGPNSQRGNDEVHRDELPEDRKHPPQERDGADGGPQLQDPQIHPGNHVDDLAHAERVALRLRPARLDGPQEGVLLRRVVHERQEDAAAPDPPLGHQAALREHVPVLRDEVGVPAPHGGREHQAQGVAGEGNMAVDGVREAGELVQGREDRGHLDEPRLRQEVLEVDDRRLPDGEVPLRLARLEEVVRQGLEVVLVQLRVVVNHRDDHPGVVGLEAVLLLQLLHQLEEGPALVGGLSWDVVRQVRRMKRLRDEGKLLPEVPL